MKKDYYPLGNILKDGEHEDFKEFIPDENMGPRIIKRVPARYLNN